MKQMKLEVRVCNHGAGADQPLMWKTTVQLNNSLSPSLPPLWLTGVKIDVKTRQQGGEGPDAVEQDKSPWLLLHFQSHHILRSHN